MRVVCDIYVYSNHFWPRRNSSCVRPGRMRSVSQVRVTGALDIKEGWRLPQVGAIWTHITFTSNACWETLKQQSHCDEPFAGRGCCAPIFLLFLLLSGGQIYCISSSIASQTPVSLIWKLAQQGPLALHAPLDTVASSAHCAGRHLQAPPPPTPLSPLASRLSCSVSPSSSPQSNTS